MKAKLKTAPNQYPITLAEAKKQCEIDDADTSHDTYVSGLVMASTSQAEQYLHRRLVTQTWNYWLDCFPYRNYLKLPFGQLQSVASLKYTDSDGDQTIFPSSDYIVDTNSEPGQIVLEYEEIWPTVTLTPVNAIQVEFVCGYYIGDTWAVDTAYAENVQVVPISENGLVYNCTTAGTSHASTIPEWPLTIGDTVTDGTAVWTCLGIAIPEPIRQAIKIHISDMFEYRETEYFGMGHTKMQTWEALLFPYKLFGGIIEDMY